MTEKLTKQFADYAETINWLEANGYKLHHAASRRGYTSTQITCRTIYSYSGRFGNGYIIPIGQHWRNGIYSTQYEDIEYWIK